MHHSVCTVLLGVNRGVLVLDTLHGSGGRQQVRDRLPVRDRVGGEVTRSVATLGKKLQIIGHPSAGEHDKLEA